MEVISWISSVGHGGAVFVLILLWREIRAVRIELSLLLGEHERRLDRIESKVFPAFQGVSNETAQMVG